MKRITTFSLSLSLVLTSLPALAAPLIYQHAFNMCITELAELPLLTDFMKKSPEEQAKQCFDIFQTSYPDIAQSIDFEIFKQEISTGAYSQKH